MKKAKLAAVIDVGSTAIRMVIAEIDSSGELRRIDRAVKPVPFGRDVFMSGRISRETVLLSLRILAGYAELLNGWRIPPEDVRVIATSAIREAKNRDAFIDRVFLRTGFRINVLEGIEENHLTYLAVLHAVKDMRGDMARTNSLIIEVGGGSTEIMLLRRGRMVAAHSLRIGTVRIEQHLNPDAGIYSNIEGYIRENMRNMGEILDAEFRLSRIKYFVAVGGDARLAAEKVGTKIHKHYAVIQRKAFLDFLARLQKLTLDECVGMLQVTYNEAEGLVPALLLYKHFLESTSADSLLVPDVSLREGVILSFALDANRAVERHFYSQVIASAVSLGRKFHFDEEHGMHVARLALDIFDQMKDDHGLDFHARLLLEASAILHDIGNYISTFQHHRHGQYILSHSEMFGYSRDDIRIMSSVVRLHGKTSRVSESGGLASLRREERILVLKLAAILRLADGLDRGHSQKIPVLRLDKQDDEILIHAEYDGDPAVERTGLRLKSEMFEEVFGYRIRLV